MSFSKLKGKHRFKLIDQLRGTSILKVLDELRMQQFLSSDELNNIRETRLNEIFQLAKSTTNYYTISILMSTWRFWQKIK